MLYGMASAGTVAWVMYQKFCNGLPYYRQEKGLETVWRGDHQSYDGKLGDPEFRSVFPSDVRILPQETSGTWIRNGR